eukprot:GEMP01052194.1.p1 GENE.GEMP01052194.1~~GEMP01052194.1.p1  ORF type:complete len:101 (-),score=5.78 GEMP01052194.1:385-687(-)
MVPDADFSVKGEPPCERRSPCLLQKWRIPNPIVSRHLRIGNARERIPFNLGHQLGLRRQSGTVVLKKHLVFDNFGTIFFDELQDSPGFKRTGCMESTVLH